MPAVTDYGSAYLDAESFRASAELFGAGMSLCDYPADSAGNAKLDFALQAASRQIDAHCARDFSPAAKTETHPLNLTTWRFSVNNPPIVAISSCKIYYAIESFITILPDRIFVNNQQNYLEITRLLDGGLTILEEIGTEIAGPQIIIVYTSLQDIPNHVRLACGFQTAHLINSGFVDKTLPPNFGKIDMGGLSVNNKKGYRSSDEQQAGSLSADAQRLLVSEIKYSAA